MILIADSGSTKTLWATCSEGRVQATYTTAGINPYYQTDEQMRAVMTELLNSVPADSIDRVYFYGAGCTAVKIPLLVRLLSALFPRAEVQVCSDLLAAARAMLQRTRGIACILGTGSNSGLYDGVQIVQNVSPLGFILGDEGSGASIGKQFVGDCLKHQAPEALCRLFADEYQLTAAEVVEHVYRRPFPNRYLAHFVPFLSCHIDEYDYIRDLVYRCFCDFLRRNVLQYPQVGDLPIVFVGSVAYHFRTVLHDALCDMNLTPEAVAQSPIDGLARFHA
ncbi:MAG: ATPase [Paludibacteraceae bacterium]